MSDRALEKKACRIISSGNMLNLVPGDWNEVEVRVKGKLVEMRISAWIGNQRFWIITGIHKGEATMNTESQLVDLVRVRIGQAGRVLDELIRKTAKA